MAGSTPVAVALKQVFNTILALYGSQAHPSRRPNSTKPRDLFIRDYSNPFGRLDVPSGKRNGDCSLLRVTVSIPEPSQRSGRSGHRPFLASS